MSAATTLNPNVYTGSAATPCAYRNTVLADRVRTHIINILMWDAGTPEPTCAGCGDTACLLEINHVFGTTWKQRHLKRYGRMLRMRREALEGLCDLRCRACNLAYHKVTPHVYSATDPF